MMPATGISVVCPITWLMGPFGEALKYKLNNNLTPPLLPLVSVHYL